MCAHLFVGYVSKIVNSFDLKVYYIDRVGRITAEGRVQSRENTQISGISFGNYQRILQFYDSKK